MNCRDTARFLNPYVDGELDLTSALAIEEHLQTCPRCRAQETELRSLRAAMRRHTDFQAAPESLRWRLQARYGHKNTGATFLGRRIALAVPALAALSLIALAGLTALNGNGGAAGQNRGKVVYHIASSDNVGAALRNLANHLDASPGVKVVVVAHNDGVNFLMRGARDEGGRPFEATVRRFTARGVEFRVCNNTLVRQSIDSTNVIPGAVLVPSGIAEISRLQSEEGYAYMKL